jgi:hypothetical protein
MTDGERLAALERQVQYLSDRQAIYDCLVATSRGNDRFDKELIVASYHPDGVHELGPNRIPAPDYGEIANRSHAAMCAVNLHTVCMHACEIDGDVAHAESYVIGLFADHDGQTSRTIAGRYIDRLERRDGKWGIVVRRTTVEVVAEGRAVLADGRPVPGSGYLKGSRDRSDPSYQRPLTTEGGECW